MVTRSKDKEPTLHPILVGQVASSLRKGKDGEKRLTKSRMRHNPEYGHREEVGGYRVVSGVTKSTVAVLWVPSDEIPWNDIDDERDRMIGLYADILLGDGFLVSRESYGLSVGKKSEEQRKNSDS